MCNLNILYVKKKKSKLTPFLMAVSSNSFATNDDGEGIYISSSDEVHKSQVKMNLFEFEKEIEESNVIISHQRLSTSGFEIDYNHPFHNKDFVLVHNGVINQFKGNKGSDTYGFWIKFNEEFNKITSHISREEKIKKVISQLFEKDEGSYSILIYDKKTKLSFYFRGNGYPSIYFYDNDEYLFITTNGHNDVFLSMISSKKFNTFDIKGRKIYKISNDFTTYKSKDLPEEKIKFFEYEKESSQSKLFKTGYSCKGCGKQIYGTIYQIDGDNYCFDCHENIRRII